MSDEISGENIAPSEDEVITTLKHGGVGVLPTDTVYGIVGRALDKCAVARTYEVKKRDEDKPCIILLPNRNALTLFDVYINENENEILGALWPGCVSVILPCESDTFRYLHKGTRSLAFRVPDDLWLREFLGRTGPLVAPSANPEGSDPATDIQCARRYFGSSVDFYLDQGNLQDQPSTLIKLAKEAILIKRAGVISADEIVTRINKIDNKINVH